MSTHHSLCAITLARRQPVSLSLYPLHLFAFHVSFVFSLLSLLVCFFFAIFVLYSVCRTCENLRGWVEMCDKQFPPGNRPAECQQRPSSSCSRPAPRPTTPRPAFSFLFTRPFSFSLASSWRGVAWRGVAWHGAVSCRMGGSQRQRKEGRQQENTVNQQQTEAVATNANIMANVSEIFHR